MFADDTIRNVRNSLAASILCEHVLHPPAVMIDEKVRLALLSVPSVTIGQVESWQRKAFDEGKSLYSVAFSDESVREPSLVKALAGALLVTPVSLEGFKSKPKLLEIFPPEICRRHLALAIGLKQNEGVMTVFVGLADPLNVDTLEELAKYTDYPIVPLLAGPADLKRAIARVLTKPEKSGTSETERSIGERGRVPAPNERSAAPVPPTARPPGSSVGRTSTSGLFSDIEEISEPLGGDAASALTLLDDIPKRRHEMQTSPNGYESVLGLSESELPDLASAGNSSLELTGKSRSGLSLVRSPFEVDDPDALSRRAPRRGHLSASSLPSWSDESRSQLNGASPQWEDVDNDRLLNALVRLLLQRGLVTKTELEQIIADLAQQ